MNQKYRTKPDMEEALVAINVKKIAKTGKMSSKQATYEEIFWLGLAEATKKYTK